MKKLLITDSGPILSLACIGRFDILPALYPDFYLSETVFLEIESHLPKFTDSFREILDELLPRVLKVNTSNQSIYQLVGQLDAGEMESILLAKEVGAGFFLVEDAKAKQIASELGLKCFGVLALLVEAKHNNLIGTFKDSFMLLIKNKRFYSVSLLNIILVENGESII
jgi:uncharacterized protein